VPGKPKFEYCPRAGTRKQRKFPNRYKIVNVPCSGKQHKTGFGLLFFLSIAGSLKPRLMFYYAPTLLQFFVLGGQSMRRCLLSKVAPLYFKLSSNYLQGFIRCPSLSRATNSCCVLFVGICSHLFLVLIFLFRFLGLLFSVSVQHNNA
jgi:hypothetical protein